MDDIIYGKACVYDVFNNHYMMTCNISLETYQFFDATRAYGSPQALVGKNDPLLSTAAGEGLRGYVA